jgi:hypothetical protein
MSKAIVIKLTKIGSRVTGPFVIKDNFETVLGTNVSKAALVSGTSYIVNDAATSIIIESKGRCNVIKTILITEITIEQLAATTLQYSDTSSLWRHLTNIQLYNNYYGTTEPYVIEYPFSYQFQDEILQNVKDYTKAFKYLSIPDGVFNYNTRIETDDVWFNKAIVYNGQQNSGLLELVPKPLNNLRDYMKYPIYNVDSKTITFTKSDNFYQYNTFWSLLKNKQQVMFNTSCESLSIDRVLNQSNMDYGKRSFKKEPLRAKDLKVRHILDNRSDSHLVSQFILTPAQISYK